LLKGVPGTMLEALEVRTDAFFEPGSEES